MLIIGLTGSIGMGKSTAAEHLRSHGLPTLDADAEVHKLYKAEAVAPIEAAFPGTTVDGVVDRAKLSAALVAAPDRIAELEAIVHPLVRLREREFLSEQADKGAPMAVLEIPLLFETGGDGLVDATIVVSAPADEQRRRLAKRANLSPEKIEKLLARQMADAEKRARADFVVDTSGEVSATRAQLDAILAQLHGRKGDAYECHWA
jgi:dephospho-CoA kinase